MAISHRRKSAWKFDLTSATRNRMPQSEIKDALSDVCPQLLKNRFFLSEWYFKEYHPL